MTRPIPDMHFLTGPEPEASRVQARCMTAHLPHSAPASSQIKGRIDGPVPPHGSVTDKSRKRMLSFIASANALELEAYRDGLGMQGRAPFDGEMAAIIARQKVLRP